ncbi:DNA primase [Elongatibacter sediminis]|uniref:DNA primase n=1 Tax=Elongatibacter sediminis TaxID=3119006 RepID=A0AAW9RH53_9GAMM
MGGLIPESFIEELLGRLDIVEIIERHVPLKRAGKEYQACCPFHDEKTPSFTVSPQKQFYHCFGCGAHGSAIGFLMNYEGLEFPDAVEELARHAGLTVPREGGGSSRPRVADAMYEILDTACGFYQEQLREHEVARDYLKSRGLSGEIACDYGIGFAPPGWDNLVGRIGTDAARQALLDRAGMLSKGKKGWYDKFRERIMFPIHDRRGRVIAFGGRAISDNGPKYLNSPETPLFHKGRELYGLHQARKSAPKLDRIIVVEGYMDVVALAQFGFSSSVATLGTAVTGDQVELMFRAADEVVFCFDGDRAGRKAAWRAVESTLPRLREGRQARFLFLPEGEDPDSMVRNEGEDRFAQRLETAQPLSEFFFRHFTTGVDMDSLDGRARLVELARPELQKLPEGVYRDMMMERLEKLAQHRFETPAPRQPELRQTRQAGRASGQMQRTPLRLALAHLVQNPGLTSRLPVRPVLPECDVQGMDIFREVVDFCDKHPNMTTAQLLELWRDHPAQPHLRTLATWPLEGEAGHQVQEFRDALTSLELQWTEARIEKMPRRLADLGPEDKRMLLDLQQRRQALRRTLAGDSDSE